VFTIECDCLEFTTGESVRGITSPSGSQCLISEQTSTERSLKFTCNGWLIEDRLRSVRDVNLDENRAASVGMPGRAIRSSFRSAGRDFDEAMK
jgi:hypothetical protein